MDTAQRFEIGWPSARRLIELCASLELRNGFLAGAGSDQFDAVGSNTKLVDAVAEQAEFIGELGRRPRSAADARALPRRAPRSGTTSTSTARSSINWRARCSCTGWVRCSTRRCAGYFPGNSLERILARHADKVRGVKLSLLDEEYEVLLRRRIGMRGQIVLTGDDYHFSPACWKGKPAPRGSRLGGTFELKGRRVALGDYSHALLGAFDAVAEPAAAALRALGDGDVARYRELMGPAEELARFIFQPPTRHYKAGLAYHAWLRRFAGQPDAGQPRGIWRGTRRTTAGSSLSPGARARWASD